LNLFRGWQKYGGAGLTGVQRSIASPPVVVRRAGMSLVKFFEDKHNNASREKMFFNRLYFDLKLAAAHRNYALTVFSPEVDRDGYDVSLDDGDLDRRFQLKTVLKSSATANWDIHKRVLRPSTDYARRLGFSQSQAGVGLQGGVILIRIDNSDEGCPVNYLFTDVFIISAFADGLIHDPKDGYRRTQAKNVLSKLHTLNEGKDLVSIPINLFVEVKNPSCLLAIVGLQSAEQSHQWYGTFLSALEKNFRTDEASKIEAGTSREAEAFAQEAAKLLLMLISDTRLKMFLSDRPRVQVAS